MVLRLWLELLLLRLALGTREVLSILVAHKYYNLRLMEKLAESKLDTSKLDKSRLGNSMMGFSTTFQKDGPERLATILSIIKQGSY